MGHRLLLLLMLTFPVAVFAQNQVQPRASIVDAVDMYLIPTGNISEEATGSIARALSEQTGLWIKSTLWTPTDALTPFAGTNQYAGEDFFSLGEDAAKLLKEASSRTYFIAVTDRDINSKTRNFRFLFSMHNAASRTSVLSIARLQHESDGAPSSPEKVTGRVAKMLLRIVGEMRLGWKRTSDPSDIMYAPIMSMEDVDRMGFSHALGPEEKN